MLLEIHAAELVTMKHNFQIGAIFRKTSHDIFIHLLKQCFQIRKTFPEHSEAKSGKILQGKSVQKTKSNPILI